MTPRDPPELPSTPRRILLMPKDSPEPTSTPRKALLTPRDPPKLLQDPVKVSAAPWGPTGAFLGGGQQVTPGTQGSQRFPQASACRRWAASRSRPRYSRQQCSPGGMGASPPRSPQHPAAMVPVESLSPPCSTALAHRSPQHPPAASRASRATMGASWPLRPGHPSSAQPRYAASRSAGDGRDGTCGGP